MAKSMVNEDWSYRSLILSVYGMETFSGDRGPQISEDRSFSFKSVITTGARLLLVMNCSGEKLTKPLIVPK